MGDKKKKKPLSPTRTFLSVALAHPDIVRHLELTRFQTEMSRSRWVACQRIIEDDHREEVAEIASQIESLLLALPGAAKVDEITRAIPRPVSHGSFSVESLLSMALDQLVSEGRAGCAPIGAGSPLRYWAPRPFSDADIA